MKNHAVARCSLLFALLIALCTAGCAGKKTYLHAEAVTAGGVRVSPADVFSNGSVLVVKINVSNQAKSAIVVDKGAMRLVLADGRILARVRRSRRRSIRRRRISSASTFAPTASSGRRSRARSSGCPTR